MNQIALLRARQEAFLKAEAKVSGPASMLSDALAHPQAAPVQQDVSMETLRRTANSAAGFEARELPFAEIARIIKMPIVLPMDKEEEAVYQRENVLAEAYNEGFRLFPVQANALMAYDMYKTLFAPIGVGFGKTGISLSIASKAYANGLRKILLCVPSNVMAQLTTTDIKWVRTKIPFNVPVHVLGGRDAPARASLVNSKKKGLYIMPYSLMSVKDTTSMLDGISPELVILDEAHNLANRGSARTKRLMHYIEARKPDVVALSGTITSKSVRDYAHLLKHCLKENSPLPHGAVLVNEWAEVIDAVALGTYGHVEQVKRSGDSPLMPLIRWAQDSFKKCMTCDGKGELLDEDTGEISPCPSCKGQRRETFAEDVSGFRKAYKYRLTTAPGVVSSGDASIGVSLLINNRPVQNPEQCEGYGKLVELTDQITDEWLTPNGDEIEHTIHCWKWLNELWGAGFYNQLTWPSEEAYARRRHIDTADAYGILEKSKEHHKAQQVYAFHLRKWIENHGFARCDTPFLVGQEMHRNGGANVSPDLFEAWQYWKSLDFEGRPDRDSTAVRVCDFKIRAAVEWAAGQVNEGEGGIIWVYHQEAGEWCHEALQAAGIESIHCPAGDQYNQTICQLGDIAGGADGKQIIVASYTAHGTGKNLQAFSHNYFLQWPRAAVQAEQTIGRTHRSGQRADELVVVTNVTSEFDQLNFAACLNDSLYIHQTMGNRQKLIYAAYEPLPRVFPSAVLAQRGLEPRVLSREQERMMRDKFGGGA